MPALTIDEAVQHVYRQLRDGRVSEARRVLQMLLAQQGANPDLQRLLTDIEPLLPLERLNDLLFYTMKEVARSNQLSSQRLYRDILADECYADPRRLERFGAKFYSQNDEDGIIAEIFRRIGVSNRTFLEFGVADGLENNTLLLTYQGWQGVWMDGSEHNVAFMQQKFAPLIQQQRLRVVQQWISVETINDVIRQFDLPEEIDLLSIDIDGNDYYVFEHIDCIRPRVCVIEYNSKLPPPILAVMRYHAEHSTHELTDYFGCSLESLTRLAQRKGYQLVSCNITGSNAFFVRSDLCGGRFYEPATAEALYHPPRYEINYGGAFRVGHPTSYGHWEEI
ncbi:MAG: FkbM family methyltransferase [Magnetococcales bacterium]|nr:FkbM family methyltransferase [Magnetococcales bacterium]